MVCERRQCNCVALASLLRRGGHQYNRRHACVARPAPMVCCSTCSAYRLASSCRPCGCVRDVARVADLRGRIIHCNDRGEHRTTLPCFFRGPHGHRFESFCSGVLPPIRQLWECNTADYRQRGHNLAQLPNARFIKWCHLRRRHWHGSLSSEYRYRRCTECHPWTTCKRLPSGYAHVR